MERTEPELVVFCYQARPPVEGLKNQPRQKHPPFNPSYLQDEMGKLWDRTCGNGQPMTD